MRILYTYEYNFKDPHKQSGRPWQLRQALGKLGHEIVDLPDVLKFGFDRRVVEKIFWKLAGRIERRDRDPRRLKAASELVQQVFVSTKCDIVVSPSTLPVAYLDPAIAVYEVLDAFFGYNLNRYESFSKLTKRYIREGSSADDLALRKSSGIVVPTDHLARALAATNLVSPSHIRVCPWGPNLTPSYDDLGEVDIERRFRARKILFVGREWRRKGFDVVMDVLRSSGGQQLSCTAIGLSLSDVPKALISGIGDRVELLGELNLNVAADLRRARAAFSEASILLVPTRAENFGITFVEALGFGLPIVTYDTDGVSSITGSASCARLLPHTATTADFLSAVLSVVGDPSTYSAACRAAEIASKRFSWLNVAETLEELISLGPPRYKPT